MLISQCSFNHVDFSLVTFSFASPLVSFKLSRLPRYDLWTKKSIANPLWKIIKFSFNVKFGDLCLPATFTRTRTHTHDLYPRVATASFRHTLVTERRDKNVYYCGPGALGRRFNVFVLFCCFFWRLLSMHVHIYITQTAESNAVSFLPKFGLSLCREIEGASS